MNEILEFIFDTIEVADNCDLSKPVERYINPHYKRLLLEQKGRCAVCSKHQIESERRFHVDHNHKTGEIRALLCNRCNSIVGCCEGNIQLKNHEDLKSAIKYLKKYE